jgi:hypothetical protein
MSMLLVLLVPLASPAGAYSVNRASKIVSISDNFDGATGVTFELKEDTKWVSDFVAGDTFQLILPDGVNWNAGAKVLGSSSGTVCATAEIVSDQVLEITFTSAVSSAVDSVVVPMDVEVDGATGDITVQVDPIDSGVSSGTYVFARVSGDATTAKALSVETIGDPGVGGDIRIEEASLASLGTAAQYIRLKLPSDFNWVSADLTVKFSGGFSNLFTLDATALSVATTGEGKYNFVVSDNELNIYFNPPNTPARTTRGMITINTPINPDKDANYGEVEVSITGSVAGDADLVVAKYGDYGVELTVDSVEEIKAGKYDQELDTITIEETVTGTLIDGRDLTLVFPTWVKITKATIKDTNIDVLAGDVDGTDNELDISIVNSSTGDNTGKIEIDLEISVEGNKSGDIEMTVDGSKAGIPEDTKLVVGKAVALVTAAADATKDVRIGVQAQEIGTITITELVNEAISEDPNGTIAGNVTLTLPEGVWFSAKPKVEVTEGNLDIKADNVTLSATSGGTADGMLNIPIDGDSTKVSTITITGVKVTVDRTVPTGDLFVKVGGGAIIENQKANPQGWLNGAAYSTDASSTTVDEGEFDTGTAYKLKVANIITPAPGEVSGTAVFTIGSTTYTLNGVVKTMDVAPYIKGDRTFLPLRFVANAVGVADNNIMWNAADQSVILIKGDRVVKLVIGSNTMLINGVAMTIDVAPELVDPGRTMLPIRWVAQALSCIITWDAATQTVTVTL